jgi:putative heme-binding domain-containing protein
VETKDGPNLVGFVISESETTLHLRLPGGLQRDLELTTIKTRKPMKQSLMPAGLETAISSQELVDLVEWLRTLPAAKERSSLE